MSKLQVAASGKKENLAGIDPIGVVDARIGAGNASRIRSVAEFRLCDLGECVAYPHGELGGGPH